MRIVAQHLEAQARKCQDPSEIDLFGRSAFNRYYYATFWIVRECLKTIDEAWAEPGHSQAPEILRGQVQRRIRKQLQTNVLPPGETAKLRSRANNSISALASLLDEARLVRTRADYKPEATATMSEGTILMAGVTSGEAARWLKLADTHTANIIDVCRKLGII